MQGRLLPKYKGQYQSHPVGSWQKEFPIASKFSLDCIEFIVDFHSVREHPFFYNDGLSEIKNLENLNNVKVLSICADCFMQSPIFLENEILQDQNKNIFKKIINAASSLKINQVVFPCVDNSSLQSEFNRDSFKEKFKDYVDIAYKEGIKISLETDLAPRDFIKLLEAFDTDTIFVNYDIGNSVAMGYKFSEELSAYGDRILDIHIKDRKLNGGSVFLGTGQAQFIEFFRSLKEYDFSGVFIMQAYRDENGIKSFTSQLEILRKAVSLAQYN